jgi:hypothetical protein
MYAQIGHTCAISARLCALTHTSADQHGKVLGMKMTGTPTPDALDLRSSVVGPDLVLTEDDKQRLVLHTVDGSRSQLLGSFDDAVEAWRALDELDSSDELDIAA